MVKKDSKAKEDQINQGEIPDASRAYCEANVNKPMEQDIPHGNAKDDKPKERRRIPRTGMKHCESNFVYAFAQE